MLVFGDESKSNDVAKVNIQKDQVEIGDFIVCCEASQLDTHQM